MLVTTDDMATWTLLREWNNTGSAYVFNDIPAGTGTSIDEISLAAYNGQTVRVAFYCEQTEFDYNAVNELHIDNLVIGRPVETPPNRGSPTPRP